MQTLLSASKAWQTVTAGSLKKREPSKKHKKNKLSLVKVVYSESKKVKQLHGKIPKA